MEDDFDLSDVDLDDDFDKDELWAQIGQDLIHPWLDLVWFCPARPASPLLWMNGRPARPVTEILQKRHMWDTCCFSHHLCQSHGDWRGGGGGGVSCPWSKLCHTYLLNVRSCIFIWPPPAEEGGGSECGFSSFSNIVSPSLFFNHPQAPIFKMCNTSMSSLMWHILFLFLNPYVWNLVGLHHVCPGQGDTVGCLV